MKRLHVLFVALGCMAALGGVLALRSAEHNAAAGLRESAQARRAAIVELLGVCLAWLPKRGTTDAKRALLYTWTMETLPSFSLACVGDTDHTETERVLQRLNAPYSEAWEAALSERDTIVSQYHGRLLERAGL